MAEETGYLWRSEPEPPEEVTDHREEGIGLCLSGGGYRAMVFHLGALWRLNELGYLGRLSRVSSVSGGSITAAVLGINWHQLDFDSRGVSRRFVELCVNPVRKIADTTIDLPSIIGGILGPGTVNRRVVNAYRQHLFGTKTLQDLPDDTEGPRFVINATNVQSGVLCRFSRPYIWDYRVGCIEKPKVEIARAVAASSAFPPVLSPAVLNFHENDFRPNSGKDLQRPPFTTSMFLTDGGVYDNLGLETVWKRYRTILVSDGGGRMPPEEKPARTWGRHLKRIISVIERQGRSLRYRELIEAYKSGTISGAYWGTHTDIQDYGVPTPLTCPLAKTSALARFETRLKKMPPRTQEELVNWGYAVCDAALRAYVDRDITPPVTFPYPDSPLA